MPSPAINITLAQPAPQYDRHVPFYVRGLPPSAGAKQVTSIAVIDPEYVLPLLSSAGPKALHQLPRPSKICVHLVSDWCSLLSSEQDALREALGHSQESRASGARVIDLGGAEGMLGALAETTGWSIGLRRVFLVSSERRIRPDFRSTGVFGGP